MDSLLRPRAHELARTDLDSTASATRLIGRVVFYGLLVLMALTAVPYGTVEPWPEALFEGAVFALCILFVIEGYLSGSWRINGLPLLYPAIALIGFSLLQSLALWPANVSAAGHGKVWLAISADPYESRRFALKLAALTIAGALLMRYAVTRQRLKILINVVIGIGVASAVFGILRQALQRQKGFLLPLLPFAQGYAQFINKNHFAFLMEMALGLGLGLIIARGVRRERVLMYVAALLAVWTALVLSNSRGGLLAMMGQLVFTLVLFIRRRTRKGSDASKQGQPGRVRRSARVLALQIALVLSLVIAVVLGVIWIGGDPLVSSIEGASTELQETPSASREGARRRDIWRASWQMFKANQIAGAGLGGYWAAVPQYHDASGQMTPQQAHNDYLELLASGGLIGAAIGVWFLILLVQRLRLAIRAHDSLYRSGACGVAITVMGVAVHSLFDFGLHIAINALIFFSLLAIVCAAAQTSVSVNKAITD
ncbi:MAG: O-antigen ligase family protein [Pyrinomonadaceae bacterium]